MPARVFFSSSFGLQDEPYPFIVPKLGTQFMKQWQDDVLAAEGSGAGPSSPSSYVGEAGVYGAHWRSDDPYCRPVTQRILAALIEENIIETPRIKEEEKSEAAKPVAQTAEDYERLEERIKEELKVLGLLGEDELTENEREDDEISFQLRYLQDTLRKQVAINNSRKARVMERAKAFMAFQEYEQLVTEVHKQIERAHLNRLVSFPWQFSFLDETTEQNSLFLDAAKARKEGKEEGKASTPPRSDPQAHEGLRKVAEEARQGLSPRKVPPAERSHIPRPGI